MVLSRWPFGSYTSLSLSSPYCSSAVSSLSLTYKSSFLNIRGEGHCVSPRLFDSPSTSLFTSLGCLLSLPLFFFLFCKQLSLSVCRIPSALGAKGFPPYPRKCDRPLSLFISPTLCVSLLIHPSSPPHISACLPLEAGTAAIRLFALDVILLARILAIGRQTREHIVRGHVRSVPQLAHLLRHTSLELVVIEIGHLQPRQKSEFGRY
mmetsp:Transcript_1675/g.4476  ORF Transcript_1675/g.4476 Transcript_1675/m.4476 type:complete len:207 (-) Transcript_1675:298-918(-)